jgi:hypothetical protein
MTENSKIIAKLLKMTDDEQKVILRVFVKLPIESKIEIFENNRSVFFKLREEEHHISLSTLSYVSLIMSIRQYRNDIDNVDKNIIHIRSKSLRNQPKRDILIGKWSLVKELKNEKNLSLRQICRYLKKYHKIEVATSTLHALWHEFEIEKEN